MLNLHRPFYNPPGWPGVQPHAPPPPPRGKPMTCALQLYNHHACMSYKKQLPVALPGHGCAARKSHDSEKNLESSKDYHSPTYLLKYKSKSFTKKGQIANNFYAKILTTNIDT